MQPRRTSNATRAIAESRGKEKVKNILTSIHMCYIEVPWRDRIIWFIALGSVFRIEAVCVSDVYEIYAASVFGINPEDGESMWFRNIDTNAGFIFRVYPKDRDSMCFRNVRILHSHSGDYVEYGFVGCNTV
jgi:hypothetical protein